MKLGVKGQLHAAEKNFSRFLQFRFRVREFHPMDWYDDEFVVIKCDSEDGKGCGAFWLEGYGLFKIACPVCGRLAINGNVIVNDGDMPDVSNLDNSEVLVVFGEQEVGVSGV